MEQTWALDRILLEGAASGRFLLLPIEPHLATNRAAGVAAHLR
jgi:hypothetical protein